MRAGFVGLGCLVAAVAAVPPDATEATRGRRRRLNHAGEVRRVARLWAETPEAHHRASPAAASLLADAAALSGGGGATLQPEGELLPVAFSWSNASGVDYLTPVRNQHIPRYVRSPPRRPSNPCPPNQPPAHARAHFHPPHPATRRLCPQCGSCWAYAATSTLADRWNIASVRNEGRLPHLQLATQHLIGCAPEAGTCQGGDDLAVYSYAAQSGIPHESCSAYMAQDMKCSAEDGITDTNRPPCYNCDEHSNCFVMPKYHKLFARPGSVRRVAGPAAMRRELHANGPLSCGIVASDKLEKRYESGVFAETLDNDSRINHVVELVGWGTDEFNNQYWVRTSPEPARALRTPHRREPTATCPCTCTLLTRRRLCFLVVCACVCACRAQLARNSWGYEWGEGGFFRIVTSENRGPLGTGNNLIEEECAFATPDRFAVE